MADIGEQETLDRILLELKSDDPARCLQALEELNSLKFSSPAILKQLENLAIHHPDQALRSRALQSLGTSVHRFVQRNVNKLNRGERLFLLKQIDQWEADGLLSPAVAEVIGSRFDFDIAAPQPRQAPVPAAEKASSPPAPPQPAIPQEPRPTLMQTLLSEASIRIYLYLGAFFVIAAALILAALVQAARLPILAVATLLFGGGALSLRKRLPQPSFALFIVFSFLLPIDANVVEETIGFPEPGLSIYWTIVFVGMAMIWGFSVWFYESRFFSAVAFVSLSLGFYRAGEIFDAQAQQYIFLGMLASLAGLACTFALKTWKDAKFALFVFLLAQVQALGLLLLSLAFVIVQSFEPGGSNGSWLPIALTWLAASSFFVLSDMLIPFVLFPWMAVGALLPLPWFAGNAFNTTPPVNAFGFFTWGAVLALASEAALRLPSEAPRKYYWPLLAGSVLLFLTSFALVIDLAEPGLTFALLSLTALVYGALHLVRARAYVWGAALLSALGAFFTLFQLPVVGPLEISSAYQLLIASTLLVVPELLARSPLTFKSETRLPALVLGIFVALAGINLALVDFEDTGRSALALLAYAVLFTLHAFHAKREWLGYFAAALESLAVIYALDHFQLDLWLPALTGLAVLYYAAGIFLRRGADESKAWGNVLADSGLVLGGLLALASLILPKEASGWYILLIALLFAVEVFARPFAWFEIGVELLLSISLYLILGVSSSGQIGHFLFAASLVWLGGDLIFSVLIQQKRSYRRITLDAGYVLVAMAVFALSGESSPAVPAIYFTLYAIFFAVYVFLQREPRLGYLVTAFLPLALIKFCDLVNFEKLILPLIALAVLYYASGYWLRRTPKAAGWEETLLFSGLTLGALTSFSAPFQGGLDASIPVAITATLFAADAFARRDVWWALPANGFYLMSYFMILFELQVDEPQYYSIGAALLGMLMHYLLTRAGSKTGAFLAGMLSQLVLLGTTYIQMVSTERLSFFIVLFLQSMVVLVYGLIQRSRSLVITPIVFSVIGVMTVIYSALKGLGPVILIGSTGVLLLMAGIIAVLMRERITKLGEQLSDWRP